MSTYASFVRAQQLRHEEDDDDLGAGNATKETTSYKSEHLRGGSGVQEVARKRARDSSFRQLVRLIWRFNHDERHLILSGILVSGITGSAYPVIGIFFGNAVISLTEAELANGGHSLNFWCVMFLMLGLVLLITYSIQGYLFAVAGSRLGSRARSLAFASILRQDMSFFDREENSSGILTAFLAIEATKLTGISGNTFGALLNGLMTIVSGIAVGCSYGWKLGLVATSTMPIMMACGFMRFWVVTETERRFKKGTDATAKACEAVAAIKTVAALAMEETVSDQYAKSLMDSHASSLVLDFTSALTYALSQSLMVFVNALLYWYGATKLIATGEYTVQQFFVCYIAVVFSAQGAGSLFSYAPEIAGAHEAAANLLYLMRSVPSIGAEDGQGEKVEDLVGDVELRSVDFTYQTRPEHKVLRDVSLVADHGQFVALVGGSGSGKTTALNLIERFYDPSAGAIMADGKDLRRLQVREFRRSVALVEQESALIGGSIRECLLSDDRPVSDEAIEDACKAFYEFVVRVLLLPARVVQGGAC